MMPFTRINALITAILGEEETVEIFKPAIQNGQPTLSSGVSVNSASHQESIGHYKYTGDKGGKITYSYTVKEGVMLYLYFPSFYQDRFSSTHPLCQYLMQAQKLLIKATTLFQKLMKTHY